VILNKRQKKLLKLMNIEGVIISKMLETLFRKQIFLSHLVPILMIKFRDLSILYLEAHL